MSLPKETSDSAGNNRPDSSLSVVTDGVFVTRHARQRIGMHHPNTGVRGALALLQRSREVEPALIAPFVGRRVESLPDRYFLAVDAWGVFVIARSFEGGSFPWAMVTYLRFWPNQQQAAALLLGAA